MTTAENPAYRTIYKYVLDEPEIAIDMPRGATILHVATQATSPTMWVLVNPREPARRRYFTVVGTGHNTDAEASEYLGTCHNVANAGLVFHVFERTGTAQNTASQLPEEGSR